MLDPDKKGVDFIFNPFVAASTNATGTAPETVDPKTITVKLALSNVSLHQLLDAVVLIADHPIKYSVERYAVVFSAKQPETEPLSLETRVFRVNTNTFVSSIRNSWRLLIVDPSLPARKPTRFRP